MSLSLYVFSKVLKNTRILIRNPVKFFTSDLETFYPIWIYKI